MEKIFITGGNPVNGTVKIVGAKNAASKMIIASLLTDDEVVLDNVPLQKETDIAREIVEMTGATTALHDHTLHIRAKDIVNFSVKKLSRKNRLSILAVAPLLHRLGEAEVPLPGGDKIGPRPVNFHLNALEKMGAQIEENEDSYRVVAPNGLKGALIELPYPSVGATETILFAAVLAEGRTVIKNAAIEPEIISLIMMLQKMGAIVERGVGRHIEIEGVKKLHGCHHTVLPDRLEAASYACIALATRGEIFCQGAGHSSMITFLNAVRRVGGEYEVQEDGIVFRGASHYRGLQLETDTHPGFATDWQQPFIVVLTQAEGTSVVHETVYQDRFGYTKVLNEMGADITLFNNCLGELPCRFKDHNFKHSAVIKGPSKLKATKMTVPDIRAGLAYVVAALVAEGTSEIDGVEHLERGYEDLYGKLAAIGANIRIE
ncbi:UDP-N-acetylglucosamine 1-carboxyvinyltransferase [Candidatus Parcubacteria bacterium]|nr:MAG: UDP-N-acetylglucosamine 1-carboxyvinyltransferase [Candidatus Parcubacteria bacterium]